MFNLEYILKFQGENLLRYFIVEDKPKWKKKNDKNLNIYRQYAVPFTVHFYFKDATFSFWQSFCTRSVKNGDWKVCRTIYVCK